MTYEAWATIWAGIISGLLGGGLAVLGAILAVRAGIRDLESTEIRKQRVLCISGLYGLRFVLTEKDNTARPEDKSRFIFELNRSGVLFADDPVILNDLRDFHDALASKVDATPRFIALIKKMGQKTRLATSKLGDSDVKKSFNLPNSNTVVQFIPVPVQADPTPPGTAPR